MPPCVWRPTGSKLLRPTATPDPPPCLDSWKHRDGRSHGQAKSLQRALPRPPVAVPGRMDLAVPRLAPSLWSGIANTDLLLSPVFLALTHLGAGRPPSSSVCHSYAICSRSLQDPGGPKRLALGACPAGAANWTQVLARGSGQPQEHTCGHPRAPQIFSEGSWGPRYRPPAGSHVRCSIGF